MNASTLALAAISGAIFLSCPAATEALAFDVASRSSSAFAGAPAGARPPALGTAAPTPRRGALVMKVSSSSKRGRDSKASRLVERNNARVRGAGRPGSKTFTDPNKVFVGNLPYDADEADVARLFADHWNISEEAVGDRLASVKVVRDWKSGTSKGYGFVQFYEPMAATAAIDGINAAQGRGWRIKGRRIRLDQGARKPDEGEAARRRRKAERKLMRQELDAEGQAIRAAVEEAEGGTDAEDEDAMSEDDIITFLEKGGLREVLPLTEETAGLLGLEGRYEDEEDAGFDEIDDFAEYYGEHGYRDGDFAGALDDKEVDDDDDDGELVYDGVFEEAYDPGEYEGLGEGEEGEAKALNREQRRAAERKRKKRKLPFKGFGAQG